jgi:hypothetical protein
MLHTWKADTLRPGSLQKMLIIGVFHTEGMRETVEGQFVKQLQDEKLQAVASNALIADKVPSRETVMQRVNEFGLDGVVVARILDRKAYETYYPPDQDQRAVTLGYQDNWYDYFVTSTEQIQAVGYTDASRLDARVETRVFDARTGKVVWSGVSDTKIDGQDPRQIESAVGAIMKSMRRGGVF